jgi:hypothetical protein
VGFFSSFLFLSIFHIHSHVSKCYLMPILTQIYISSPDLSFSLQSRFTYTTTNMTFPLEYFLAMVNFTRPNQMFWSALHLHFSLALAAPSPFIVIIHSAVQARNQSTSCF